MGFYNTIHVARNSSWKSQKVHVRNFFRNYSYTAKELSVNKINFPQYFSTLINKMCCIVLKYLKCLRYIGTIIRKPKFNFKQSFSPLNFFACHKIDRNGDNILNYMCS